MSDPFETVIARAEEEIRRAEQEVVRLRRMVNDLCRMSGRTERYPDTQLETQTTISSIRGDQFYGQPLSAAVRHFLEMRRASNLGPATVAEIHEGLRSGGYNFNTSNEENAKRILRISLTKNTSIFHRLPNGAYGLLEWYPAAKEQKAARRANGEEEQEQGGDQETTASEG